MTPVRTFKSGTQLSVELHNYSWFVTMKLTGEEEFSTHCGPYSTKEQAIDWIKDIREER